MVGLRLGYGSILSGDVAYWRKYTMVTPVATADEGRFLNKFILNLLMPFNCRKKPASRERVLIIEDYIEGRGKVRYRTLGTFLEFNLTGSQVVLGRSFVGFKNSKEFQKVVYFRDRVRYHEGKFRIFLKFLGFFHSNPFYAYLQKGRLHRNTIEMSVPHSGVSGSKRQAIEKLLLEGDPSLLEKEGSRLTLEDNYFERKSYLKMLGLQNRSVYRVDSIRTTNMREKTEHVPTKTAVQSKAVGSTLSRKDTPSPRSGIWSPGAKKFRHYLQVESRKLNSWRFFDNGERYHSSVRLTAETDGHGAVLKPLLKLSLQVDDRSTHNKELRNGYVRFLNTVASDADFIAFDPSLHTVNRLWGYTQTFLDVEFYPEAIESLVNIKAENLWKTLAEVTGKPVEFWRKSSFVLRHPRRPVHFDTPEQYLARKARFLIRTLRKAGKCRSQSRRMEYVVKGLRKCVYKSGYTFEPVLLAVLLKLVDPADIYMRGVIKMPDNKELIFPAGVPLSNQKGKIRDNEFPAFHFIFDDPSEIYHVF
ncbi:MAG: hypothetical protein GY765_26285 [bacterium]|nr:hypothetical protein [bacterium]